MDIYVNRLESVTLACKNVFYRPEQNTKEGPYEIEFWSSWNAKMKYTKG